MTGNVEREWNSASIKQVALGCILSIRSGGIEQLAMASTGFLLLVSLLVSSVLTLVGAWLSRSLNSATSTLAPVTSSLPEDCTWIAAR